MKAELKGEKYSYRCKFRSKCGIIINISKEELIQHEKEKNHNTQIKITSNQKEHTCKEKADSEIKIEQKKKKYPKILH